MMERLKTSVIITLSALTVGLGFTAQSVQWKKFQSTKYHYIVQYPGSWHLFVTELKPDLEYLDIVNFPPSQRAEGVVLIDGGAEITVGQAPDNVRTIEEWIKRNTELDSEVTRRDVSNGGGARSGCEDIIEVTSLSEVGPGRKISVADYYCSTVRGLYAVSLKNWAGEPNEKEFRRIALDIARSLRGVE